MIRTYKPEDTSALVDIWLSASAIAHPFLSDEFKSQESDNLRNLYLPNAETWVIEYHEAPAGFIAMIGNEIGGLFLDPDRHGRGMGKSMLEQVRALHAPLEVEVFTKNAVGRQFYDRQGFVEMHRYVHEATGEEVIRMKLE